MNAGQEKPVVSGKQLFLVKSNRPKARDSVFPSVEAAITQPTSRGEHKELGV
jgi:hypothetical protein